MKKYISVDRKNSKKTVFHTDRNCVRIKSNIRPVDETEINHHDLRLCKFCDPEIDDPINRSKQDLSYQQALKENAKHD